MPQEKSPHLAQSPRESWGIRSWMVPSSSIQLGSFYSSQFRLRAASVGEGFECVGEGGECEEDLLDFGDLEDLLHALVDAGESEAASGFCE